MRKPITDASRAGLILISVQVHGIISLEPHESAPTAGGAGGIASAPGLPRSTLLKRTRLA